MLKSVDKPYSDCEEILNPGPIQRLLQSKISENGVNENVVSCNILCISIGVLFA